MFPNYHSPEETSAVNPAKLSSAKFTNLSTYSERPIRDLLTIFALSLHSLFEGLAIGVGKNSKDVWTLFAGTVRNQFGILKLS